MFNPILILVNDAWCFHPTMIHVSSLPLNFIKLSVMHAKLIFFMKGMVLSHLGRHFYSRFIPKGLPSFLWFDKILASFCIDLQVHKMKAVTCSTSTAVKYAPEEQSQMQYTEISLNHRKENLPIHMNQL